MPQQDHLKVIRQTAEAFIKCGRNQEQTARLLGIARSTLQGRLAHAVRAGLLDSARSGQAARGNASAPREGITLEQSTDSASLVCVSREIRTVEDALAKAEVNLREWEVDRSLVNSWEVATKDPETGDVTVTPLWQVKVWLRRKTGPSFDEARETLLADIAAHRPAWTVPGAPAHRPRGGGGERFLFEVSPSDLHLGNLSWREETGEDFDCTIADRIYAEAITALIERAAPYAVEKCVLVIGNDFLHVDSGRNETTGGTKVEADTRWHRAFRMGWQAVLGAAEALLRVAPVEVKVVPGNHDRERMFCLGDVLYALSPHIRHLTVDNNPSPRKYAAYGRTLLGWTHGSEERHADLPLIMAREQPDAWAASTHREWHIGHLHRRRESRFNAGDTHGGVIVRILPSLSATDAWHHARGFVRNERAAEAYLWSNRQEYAGHFSVAFGPEDYRKRR